MKPESKKYTALVDGKEIIIETEDDEGADDK